MKPREPQKLASLSEEFRKLWGLTGTAPSAPVSEFDLAAEVRRQRLERFKRFCPAEFQTSIDRSLIRNLPAWDEADKWTGSFPGIWLWSRTTGEAKTRMLWRKYGQLHVERGLVCTRVTGLNLAESYHDHYQKNATSAFYSFFRKDEIVMLDDLDKMSLPDSAQGFGERDQATRNARMLRELFDTFYEEKIRILVTANEPIAWFAERIGESAERRMRAVCGEVAF